MLGMRVCKTWQGQHGQEEDSRTGSKKRQYRTFSMFLDSLGFMEAKVLIWVFNFQQRLPISLSVLLIFKVYGGLVLIKYMYISLHQRS